MLHFQAKSVVMFSLMTLYVLGQTCYIHLQNQISYDHQ